MIGIEASVCLMLRRGHFRRVAAMLTGVCLLTSPALRAEDGARPEVKDLLTEAIAEYPGHEVTMITVTYPPGGESKPHRHDAYVFVYVLKGAVEMQVKGKPARVVHAGETFVERPADVHEVSRNVSNAEPATFLVVALKSSGKSLTAPATGR